MAELFRFYVNSWGREKGNRLKQCQEYSRHCFYVWQNRIRLLKLWKLRMPKHTRFRTFVLLLQPSMKPFDQGTSIEFKISRNQLRYALIQSENSGRPIVSADRSQSISFGFPAADDLARITSRNSFIDHFVLFSIHDNAVVLFSPGVALEFVDGEHFRQLGRLKGDVFEISRCGRPRDVVACANF